VRRGTYIPDDVAWSPDSQWLVIRRGGEVQCANECFDSQTIVDPFTQRATIVWAELNTLASRAIWSPDRKRLAFIGFTDTSSKYTYEQFIELHILNLERP
jgi:hypothetical protein